MVVKDDGREQFAAWVEGSGMSLSEIGRRLNVSGNAVRWWLDDTNVPSEPLKREIQRLTRGKVKASAWRVVDRRKSREAS